MDKHVVDTNVLIVASAADDGSPFHPDATPVEEAALRIDVLTWLQELECSTVNVVLDWDWTICGEYQNKLTEQDYGWLVMMQKRDRNQVEWVGLSFDADGFAVLGDCLQDVIHDAADRKMVAATIAAGGVSAYCTLVNACDTDWLDWQDELGEAGVEVQQLLPDWIEQRWRRKHS